MSDDCIFCKIVKGEIPSRKVYESESSLAFLDINPVARGHTVVIPKKHYQNMLDISEGALKPFFSDLKKVSAKLKEKLDADGFNLLQNNFRAAGQLVDHFHFHVIPRRKNDKAFKFPEKIEASDEELDAIQEKLQ